MTVISVEHLSKSFKVKEKEKQMKYQLEFIV